MAPQLPNYKIEWADDFNGTAGHTVNLTNWHRKTGENQNHEIQHYTTSAANCHLSGDGTLYIIPLKDQSGTWTSARLEGKHNFTCPAGSKMIFQAEIKLGTAPPANQNGIWPAWWCLGQNVSDKTVGWPKCGEWDILENRSGETYSTPTMHYQDEDGQRNSMNGPSITFDPTDFHTWALKWDRTPSTWQQETVTWYLDGKPFKTLSGSDMAKASPKTGGAEQWEEIAHKPFFPLLNVAVGGDYGGLTDENTEGGIGSGMSVKYVAVYMSEEKKEKEDL